MTIFNAIVVLEDAYGRKTRKMFELSDISDVNVGAEFLTARGLVAGMVADLAALSEARVLSYEVKERVVYTDTADAGANIDEGITLVVEKVDNFRAILKVPAPVNSVIDPDGTVDIVDALVTAYFTNFTADFTLSDGELASTLISGRLDK